jgi:hypothetical protein
MIEAAGNMARPETRVCKRPINANAEGPTN